MVLSWVYGGPILGDDSPGMKSLHWGPSLPVWEAFGAHLGERHVGSRTKTESNHYIQLSRLWDTFHSFLEPYRDSTQMS